MKQHLKVLVVGEYAWPWYQEACAEALETLECNVVRFGWLEHFKRWKPGKTEPIYRSLWHRLEYRLLDGFIVRRVNRDLIKVAVTEVPDVVWLYSAVLVHPETIRTLRRHLPRAVFCQSTNDNPFSKGARSALWRHFIGSIPLFDLHFAFRLSNIDDFVRCGAKEVRLMMAYFVPEVDFPINRDQVEPKFLCDVVFAGHYEDDGRMDALEAICSAGFTVKLFGGGWNAARDRLSQDSPLHALFPVQPVTGRDYTQAICGAKIALCFLSTLNEDTYTRRSFQIPAMKVAMLSQRTEDLCRMFTEGKEVVFFSNTDELMKCVEWLLGNPTVRQNIADGGHSRVYMDGHDVKSRMQQWLDCVEIHWRRRYGHPDRTT